MFSIFNPVADRFVFFVSIVSLGVGLTALGCEHADPAGAEADRVRPTLQSIQENVFSTSCALAGCHAGSSPQQGLNLSAGRAHENLVDVRSNERPDLLRVAPGAPDSSYLIHKVEGRSSIVGEQMPLGGEPLSQEEISALRTWIERGAPEN